MLIKTFQESYPIQYLLLILVGLAIWAGAFIHPLVSTMEVNKFLTPGGALLQSITFGIPVLNTSIAFVITFLTALLLNYVMVQNNVVERNTLVPALVFIVFYGHSASYLSLHPAIIAGFFMILALNNLLSLYTDEQAYEKVFNIGFFISLASFFYLPAIYLLVFVWFSFIIYSLYQWREWLISIIGLITPYLFLWVWFFWNDELDIAFENYQSFVLSFSGFHYSLPIGFLNYTIEIVIALFFLWALFKVLARLDEKPITIRKRYWAIFWMFFITFINFFIAGDFFNATQAFLMIPMTIFVSVALLEVNRKWVIELIFGLLVVLIIINNLMTAF